MGADDPGGPVFLVPWTANMALRAARAVDLPRAEQLARIRSTADEGRLPVAAINALILAGYIELADSR
jgi:hypothetical protein